ncbi:MAG: Rne/Rng family ribonuclease, partial [Rhodospirillales bacterium]|nr:Rne/Rng family ribonuclease [Rhodospirillales bacterium]
MIDEILVNVAVEGPRIALLEDGVLQEVILAPPHRRNLLGNVYLARIQRVLPGMQAAFVDIGEGRAAFMGAREARSLAPTAEADREKAAGDEATGDEATGDEESEENGIDAPLPSISQCVHEGQVVLVQVIKDPVGDKGARVTASVGLAGRNLVFVPTRATDAFSRRIAEEEDRERLGAVMAGLRAAGRINDDGAFILRTAALTASDGEIGDDAAGLQKIWRDLPKSGAEGAKVPSLLYEDQGPVTRALRDNLNDRVRRVLFDDADALARAKKYVTRVMPGLVDRLGLFTGPGLLFDPYEIDAEIESVLEAKVSLRSGGWITVEATEALTVVDVNSGSYVDPAGLENTSLVTNLEAVREVARQLRLRRIGGIVVIDLIHMAREDSAQAVLDLLHACLAKDRTPTQVLGISEL